LGPQLLLAGQARGLDGGPVQVGDVELVRVVRVVHENRLGKSVRAGMAPAFTPPGTADPIAVKARRSARFLEGDRLDPAAVEPQCITYAAHTAVVSDEPT